MALAKSRKMLYIIVAFYLSISELGYSKVNNIGININYWCHSYKGSACALPNINNNACFSFWDEIVYRGFPIKAC